MNFVKVLIQLNWVRNLSHDSNFFLDRGKLEKITGGI